MGGFLLFSGELIEEKVIIAVSFKGFHILDFKSIKSCLVQL